MTQPGYKFAIAEEVEDAYRELQVAYNSEPMFECISFEKFVSDFANSNDPLAEKAKLVWTFVIAPNMG